MLDEWENDGDCSKTCGGDGAQKLKRAVTEGMIALTVDIQVLSRQVQKTYQFWLFMCWLLNLDGQLLPPPYIVASKSVS